MKTHDLTNGWTLTQFDNGAMAITCSDPSVTGIALNPEQAARLVAIVLDSSEPDVDAIIAERERGLDQILDERERTGL